jgi:putative transcription factor
MPEIYCDWEPVVLKKKVTKTTQVNKPKIEEDDGDIPKKLLTYSVELSTAMQQARKAKKLTQADLAKQLNIQTSIINDIECGKALYNRKTYSTIMKKLGCDIKTLNLPK